MIDSERSIMIPRHQRLIDALATRRFLHLEDAVEITGASLATVRRDFLALSGAGLAQRFRGGIRLPSADTILPFNLRDHLRSPEKNCIAKKVASMLRPGDVLFVDGGTSTAHLAICLPEIPLRIITNSVRLAATIDERLQGHDWEVHLTGGYLHPRSGLLVGPAAAAAIEQYRAHWALLSVGGISVDGYFNTTEAVVETERRMIARAEQTVVLADHSKFGRPAMCRVSGLDSADMVITDTIPASPGLSEAFRHAGVRIVVAEN